MFISLLILSVKTTELRWHGGFLPRELRIRVSDSAGRPVQNAVLKVYKHSYTEYSLLLTDDTGRLCPKIEKKSFEHTPESYALGYPIYEFKSENSLKSDSSGLIIGRQVEGGIQFGGSSWKLFWLIPAGDEEPKFDGVIYADGFQPLTLELSNLFECAPNAPVSTVTINEQKINLSVCELTYILKRSR